MDKQLTVRKFSAKSLSLWRLGWLAALGFAATLNTGVVTLTWLVVVLFSVYAFFTNKPAWIWYSVAISPFMELWARVTKASLVPMEVGKYYLVLAIIMLYLLRISERNKPRSLYNTGVIIIVFLLPSLVVALRVFSLDQWVFNVLSIVELALLLNLASKERWDIERFCKTLQIGSLGVILILVYISFKSPGLSEINFALNANDDAAGGFGSNQVSTILGLGIAYIMALIVLRRPFIKLSWLNYVLVGMLLFRALLTFSRGGVIGGMVTTIIMLLPAMLASHKTFLRYSLLGVVVGLISFSIFKEANSLTGNKLLLRYEGETAGTLSGDKAKNFNAITSGRGNIIEADVEVFFDNVLFGAGPGEARFLREKYGAVRAAAHTEYTRLLSEHGIGGLLVDIILIVFPVVWLRKQKLRAWKGVSAGLFFLAIFSAAHSATRTNITIVAYVLAAMPIYYFNARKTQSAT